jgi:RimJ/RimL family protein N-acetyltransferase
MPEHARFEPVADARPGDRPWPAMAWPPEPGSVLTGKVIEARPADPDRDAAGLHAALDHTPVWRHVPGRLRTAAAWEASLREDLADGRVPWVIRLLRPLSGLPAGAVAGVSSYLDVSAVDGRLEIGRTLYPPAIWGTQVNPEAKLLLLGLAFDELGAGRVQLQTDVRNTRSQRAIERLGARYEGTLRRHKRRDDGTVRDSILFSITAEEWPAVRSSLEERLSGGG